jgi:hypothetical protein
MSNKTQELRSNIWGEFKSAYQNLATACTANNSITVTTIDYKSLFSQLQIDSSNAVRSRPTTFVCRCMDERCQQFSCKDEKTMGRNILDLALPGVGSLLTDLELQTTAELILKKGSENGLQRLRLFPHQGCGAAALAKPTYIERTGHQDPTAKEVEEYFGNRGYEIFKKVADYHNYNITIEKPEYQSSDKMMKLDGVDCTEIHPALGIAIVDFDGIDLNQNRPQIYDFLKNSKLPFFLITDYGEKFDDIGDVSNWRSTAKEVELASHIMEGEHGMGDNFNLPILLMVNSVQSKKRADSLIRKIHINMLKTRFNNNDESPRHHHFVIVDFSEESL